MKQHDRLAGSLEAGRSLRRRAISMRRQMPAAPPLPEVTEQVWRDLHVWLAQKIIEMPDQHYLTLWFHWTASELEKYKRAEDPISLARKVLAEAAVDVTPKSSPPARS